MCTIQRFCVWQRTVRFGSMMRLSISLALDFFGMNLRRMAKNWRCTSGCWCKSFCIASRYANSSWSKRQGQWKQRQRGGRPRLAATGSKTCSDHKWWQQFRGLHMKYKKSYLQSNGWELKTMMPMIHGRESQIAVGSEESEEERPLVKSMLKLRERRSCVA